jgi:hypothetical protein
VQHLVDAVHRGHEESTLDCFLLLLLARFHGERFAAGDRRLVVRCFDRLRINGSSEIRESRSLGWL